MNDPHWLSHWGLTRSPFVTSAGLAEPYPSQAFDEAVARIDYLVTERRRMGALLGEPGEGKSTVLRHVAATATRRGAGVVLVDAVALSPRELLWQIASQLGAAADPADDLPMLWRRVEDTLAHHRWQNRDTLLLIDDADQAGHDAQQHLVRLAGLEATPDARWTLLVATAPQRLGNLTEALLHRIDLRVDLFPWTEEDTVGFVQHSLFEAGCVSPVFSDDALVRLHEQTRGLPRHIARLADFALLAGASAGAEQVGPELVDAAFDQLRWTPPPAHLV
ncbi:MAG: AAA family ATPase [Planctomycetota bacterium]